MRQDSDSEPRPEARVERESFVRVDLHCHTLASPDSILQPAELLRRARAAGLDRIAVTDHDRIDGALEAAELDPHMVIPGAEITCRGGSHLIGLFLNESIPGRLPVEEVADRIREQRGVVYAPHPFAYGWRPERHARRVLDCADMIEVFNARAFLPRWNRLARQSAARRGLPMAASSDAHFPWEIGSACTVMPTFHDAASFLVAAERARPVGSTTVSPFVHVASCAIEGVRLCLPNGLGGARRGRIPPAPREAGGDSGHPGIGARISG